MKSRFISKSEYNV